MDPNQQGTGLSQQIGPLKLWQWGAGIIVVAVVYLYWRNKQSAGSGGVQDATGGYTTGDVNSGDYASGYDYGYAAGLNAGGSGSGSSTTGTTEDKDEGNAKGPIAHNRFTARTKDPSGKMHTVSGYGSWIHKNGRWYWQVGIPRQFALVGNGTGTGASSTAADTNSSSSGLQAATAGDAAPVQSSMSTAPAPAGAVTLDQSTGTAQAATAGGSAATTQPVASGAVTKPPVTSTTVSGHSGTSAPVRTATNAQRIAQIVKDLQNPGPNFDRATQQRYLTAYHTLTGHAYTGKLGQLQVGQHVQYATV